MKVVNCAVKMNKFILTIFVIALNFSYIEMMTEAQMKSTAKLMRNVCQPKNKATNEQIENMHKGIFENVRETQCYMFCCLQMMKVVNKDGKFLFEAAYKLIPTLPPKYQEPTKKTIEECKDKEMPTDPCEIAFEFAKCMYFRDPEYYFLP